MTIIVTIAAMPTPAQLLLQQGRYLQGTFLHLAQRPVIIRPTILLLLHTALLQLLPHGAGRI
jgi:hypothetical protein